MDLKNIINNTETPATYYQREIESGNISQSGDNFLSGNISDHPKARRILDDIEWRKFTKNKNEGSILIYLF